MQNKLLALTATVAIAALMVASFALPYAAASKGPRTVTETFFVKTTSGPSTKSGTTGVVDTGISLVPGASVTVTASGTGIWDIHGANGCNSAALARGLDIFDVCSNPVPNCEAGADASGVGTAAADGNTCGFMGPLDGVHSMIAPSLKAFSLIGQTGSGPYFQLGTNSTITGQSGDLKLAYNDDFYRDNTRGFSVTVSYTCYPGNGFGDVNHIHCGPPGLN